jgi:tetratricopeptide (TPR) repeat protein
MPIPQSELTIDFGPVRPNAPENASVRFTVRNEQTGESWSKGKFRCPLDDKALGDVRWYLEEYGDWPFGPFRERAHTIEAQLEPWGRALFGALFYAPEPARIYEHFLDTPADVRTLTLVSDAPRVMRLPWELLAESSGPLFTKRPPISIRRRVRLEHAPEVRQFALPLRVLLVTARPEGAGFVDPRSIARGVFDALERLGGAVQVDFLRPPTLAALDGALRRAEGEGRPYHIVHFDGHGVYHPHTGLGQLAFEHDDCSLDLVDADRLGALLNECGVPLAILNACQSAQGDQSNPFSSIATRLLEAGMGGVLSMSHSVLVVTAARFVAAFYGALVEGATVGRAADEARRVLVQDARRYTAAPRPDAPEEAVDLHDWFLPVLYQQPADAAPFAALGAGFAAPAPAPPPEALVNPGVPGGLPPDPLHGFHGRARELLRLERLFRDHPVVVLHGYGGQGKTALAAEAARWLHRTGRFPRGAAFVSFERGAGADLALSWTRQPLLGDDFASAGQVAEALRETPGLVVFDNLETILPRGDLPLAPAALQELLDMAWAWVGGDVQSVNPDGPRLLITTRDADLGDPRYAPSRRCAHVELGGLDRHESLELAKAVLADRGIDHATIPPEPLSRLMGFLGGHPLSLYLVLPYLKQYSPDELMAEFDQLLPGFTAGAARERNESLLVSLDFSLRRLSDDARAALPDLAVFAAGAFDVQVVQVTQMDWNVWQATRSELVQAGLATVDEAVSLGAADLSDGQPVSGSYVKFHPTLLPYLSTRLSPDRRAALEERYRQVYYALANYLHQSDTQNPQSARAIALREMPNLRRALDLALAHAAAHPDDANALEAAVDFADSIARFLDAFGLRREAAALRAKIQNLNPQGPTGPIALAEVTSRWQHGLGLLGEGRARQAERAFRELLARIDAGAAFDAGYQRAATLAMLGRALRAQGRPAEAADLYRQELSGLANLEQSEQVRRQAGAAQADLADVLTALGCYAEAREHYGTALEIVREIDDRRSVAVVLGQLGTLALQERNYPEARRRYQGALKVFQALGEPEGEAIGWHQLGRVAEEERDWDEAERCYREALQLSEAGNNLAYAASTANQLGVVCEGAGRLAEAETWFRRALAIAEQLGSRKETALRSNNLAGLLLEAEGLPAADRPAPFAGRDLLDEAEEYAQRAREIKEQLGPSTEPWTTYGILAQIAERRGHPDEARQWRRKGQESFAAFAGSEAQLPRWVTPVAQAVVAACAGNQEARQQVEGLFPQFEQGNWRIVDAIKRIWNGERDLDALTDGIDRNSALIVRRILAALAGEALPSPPTAAPPQQREGPGEGQGITLEQLFGLVESACHGDTQAGQLAYALATQGLQASAAPPESHALGKTLQRILEGLRGEEAMAGLPPELRPPVEELLRRIASASSHT